MTFQPDLEVREKVFRKMEWKTGKGNLVGNQVLPKGYRWLSPNGDYYKELPPIETTWEVCAEYLVPFMREKHCDYLYDSCFEWENGDGHTIGSAEIHNDNIALTACKAFMEVEI